MILCLPENHLNNHLENLKGKYQQILLIRLFRKEASLQY